jgi:acid phosphatase
LRSAILDPDASPGSSARSGDLTTLEWKRRLETFASDDDSPVLAVGPNGELDDICDMGSLTDLGRESTFALGRRLRTLYIDRLGFIPPSLASTDFLYLRTTPVPRAIESLQQAFAGLYPAYTRSADLPPPTIITRPVAHETLFPNDSSCRRFAVLSRAFARRTAERWNSSPEMAYLNKKIGHWMPEDNARVAVNSHPRLSGIMDTINASLAHGPETRLPADFYDERVRAIIEKIGVEEWYSGYKESQEYRMLGIGGLLGDVVARMVASAESRPTEGHILPRSMPTGMFAMSGCHDTTLAGVLASLGAFETDKWPPFTSHIAIEMFRKSEPQPKSSDAGASWSTWLTSFVSGAGASSGLSTIGRRQTPDLSKAEKRRLEGYYVRVRYNDVPVTIPGCKTPGNHLEGDESFCTLVGLH